MYTDKKSPDRKGRGEKSPPIVIHRSGPPAPVTCGRFLMQDGVSKNFHSIYTEREKRGKKRANKSVWIEE